MKAVVARRGSDLVQAMRRDAVQDRLRHRLVGIGIAAEPSIREALEQAAGAGAK